MPIPDYPLRTLTSPEHRQKADELLAIRCQLGEAGAFDDLIARWQPPLWTYVRRLAGQDDAASEIVQDVWIRVIRGIPRMRDASKVGGWLFGIARRTLMDHLRDQYAGPPHIDAEMDELPAQEVNEEREDDVQELEEALARLPIVEREILTLFYLQELSLAETAATLQIPVGTVKSRLFRARTMLRREMQGEGSPT